MASAIKDFSYVFAYSKKLDEYSTLARLMFASFMVAASIIVRFFTVNDLDVVVRLTLILLIEILITSHFKSMSTTLKSLKLVAIFVVIGAIIHLLSYITGWVAPRPQDVVMSSIQIVALFLAFSLYFQLISLSEWRRLLHVAGFKQLSTLFTFVVTQIPISMYYASEAFTTIRLKYGNKRIYKVVVPLVLLSMYTARSLAESYYLYGVHSEFKLSVFKFKDTLLYSVILVLLATYVFTMFV
jgi:hypothetical protein